jgi:ABC-type dipeptide/oligopeptide/nickel transport system permease subunit
MAPETKKEALKKVETIQVGVGYPETWRDYGSYQVSPDGAYANEIAGEKAEYAHQLAKIGKPFDKNEWWMTPQTVNAVNLPVEGIALIAGVAAGMFSLADKLLMRLIDAFLAVPVLLLFLLVSVHIPLNGPRLIFLLSLMFWPYPARMIRSQVLSTRSRKYIEVARGFGASMGYMTLRHLIPELYPVLFTGFLTRLRSAVFIEAGLAFLGVSDPTVKSWGTMLHFARQYLYLGGWANWILPVAVCIFCMVLGYTLMGQSLQGMLIRGEA